MLNFFKLPANCRVNSFYFSILTRIWPLASVHFGPWLRSKMAFITVRWTRCTRFITYADLFLFSQSQSDSYPRCNLALLNPRSHLKRHAEYSTERKIPIFFSMGLFSKLWMWGYCSSKIFHNARLYGISTGGRSKKNKAFIFASSWKALTVMIHPFFFPLSLNIFSWAGARSLRHIVSLMRMFVSLWVS